MAKLFASAQEIIRTIFLCYHGFKEEFTDKLAKKIIYLPLLEIYNIPCQKLAYEKHTYSW